MKDIKKNTNFRVISILLAFFLTSLMLNNGFNSSLQNNQIVTYPSPSIAAPDAPENVQSEGFNGLINITWEPASGSPTGYRVYRGTAPSTATNQIADVSSSTLYVEDSRTNGELWYYNVTAYNAVGDSPQVSVAGMAGYKPDAPQNTQITLLHDALFFDWDAPADFGSDSVLSYYRIFKGNSSEQVLIAEIIPSLTDWTDGAVDVGTEYYFYVTAVTRVGESVASDIVSAVAAVEPNSPQNFNAVVGDKIISLSWDLSTDNGSNTIKGYKIYRGTSSSLLILHDIAQDDVSDPNIDDISNSYIDDSVTPGIEYFYRIAAYNDVGDGSNSTIISKIAVEKPSAPQNIQIILGDSTVLLIYDAPASSGYGTINNYTIYRGTTENNMIALKSLFSLSYTDDSVIPGITYYYKISAKNEAGYGVNSTVAQIKAATTPSVPVNPTISSSSNTITLNWGMPTDTGNTTILKYQIYRSTTEEGDYILIDEVNGDILSYLDNSSDLEQGVNYYYKIRAVNAVGYNETTSINTMLAQPPGIPGYRYIFILSAISVGLIFVFTQIRKKYILEIE